MSREISTSERYLSISHLTMLTFLNFNADIRVEFNMISPRADSDANDQSYT